MCPGLGGAPRSKSFAQVPRSRILGRWTSALRSSRKFTCNEFSEVEAVPTSGVVWLTTATLQDHQPPCEHDPYRGTRDGEIGDDVAHIGG
jgi:hypothetical protein